MQTVAGIVDSVVDDLGRIALNVSWARYVQGEDGFEWIRSETILFATPTLPPSNALNVVGIDFTEGHFQMTFDGEPDVSLTLESTTDFIHWNTITQFTVVDQPVSLTDPNVGDDNAKFYRIIQTP